MQTIEYITQDKSEWGEGPWNNEPDKIQWLDKNTELPCLIVRNRGGALCGYVGVSPSHPLHGVGYNDGDWETSPEAIFNVHGGLTFTGSCMQGDKSKVVCHVPDKGEEDNIWWFGFDCAHCEDYSPAYEARYKGLKIGDFGGEYRTIEYVLKEVRQLASQLKEKE